MVPTAPKNVDLQQQQQQQQQQQTQVQGIHKPGIQSLERCTYSFKGLIETVQSFLYTIYSMENIDFMSLRFDFDFQRVWLQSLSVQALN